jgi:head-tail adaptor
MRRVRSGLMRTPFRVFTRTTTVDEFGSLEPEYTHVGTVVWGYMRGTSALEGVEREQVVHQRSYEIMMREKDAGSLTATDRLESERATFEILGIEIYDERQQTVTVRVREVS